MKITKITFEDGTENEFKELNKEEFGITEKSSFSENYWFRNQFKKWEEKNIIQNIETDLEDWAKEEYDLKDEDENVDISDFSNSEILKELRRRRIVDVESNHTNIINEDFIQRLTEIISRGDDREIDLTLEMLEKKFHIK